jgi:hypothetical protein
MAATSRDVALAVLALDAYNEGYSPGMYVIMRDIDVEGTNVRGTAARMTTGKRVA